MLAVKIKALSEMEEYLLRGSSADDLRIADGGIGQNPEKILSAYAVRRDISVIARIMIRGYCGWPFHNEIVKRKILSGLIKIYENASDMAAKEFFERLRPIFAKVPDQHLSFDFGGFANRIKTSLSHENKNVGRNLAAEDEKFKIEKHGRILVLAISTLSNWSDNLADEMERQFFESIADSDSLIIDLRGNGGGNDRHIQKISKFLYGAETPWAMKGYIRATPEGSIIQNAGCRMRRYEEVAKSKDPALTFDYSKTPWPKFSGWARPIYFLTDGETCSSAEDFIYRLKRHPFMKLVGDATSGCAIFANVRNVWLPESNIKMNVSVEKIEMEWENFECNGFKPDIPVKAGQDAFAAAKSHFLSNGR